MNIEWISVEDQLPKDKKRIRCLAKCVNVKKDPYCASHAWRGIVDVYFDKNSGWNRCENGEKDIFVTHWIFYPGDPET